MRALFKQNPKVKKYQPKAITRSVGAIDLDRKGELEKFRKWLDFVGKEKSDFPEKDELEQISKDAKSSRASGLAILGLLAAMPLITPMLSNLGLGNIGKGITDFTSGLKLPSIPGLPGNAGGPNPSTSNIDNTSLDDSGSGTSIPRGIGAMGSSAASKLFGRSGSRSGSNKTTSPSSGRRGVTQSGGLRNPLRQRPGVTTSGGGRLGRPDIRSPLRQRARVTQGAGGQKGLDKLVKRLFNSKVGLKTVGKFIRPIIKRIPFIGFLIDFALNVFLFKENLQRAAFKAIGAGLGTWLGAGVGTVLGGGLASWITGPVGAFFGAQGGDMLGGWIYDQVFGNSDQTKTTAPSDMSPDEIMRGSPPTDNPDYQRVSYETSNSSIQSQVTSGQVVQWLHGNPGREGYRADHGGDNAHDHFSFKTRAAAVAAFRALKKAGYKPNEFEGFTSVGRHSPTGGHFGPYGQQPTYNDTSDGVAFDIPWATYGSGPITQKDFDMSFRAAQIVGAVQGGNVMGPGEGMLVQQPGEEPAYGSGRTAVASNPRLGQFESLVNLFESTPMFSGASGVKKDANVAMLSPEAEAMIGGVTIIREQAPPAQSQSGGPDIVPVAVGGQSGMNIPAILTGASLDTMYDTQQLLRTA